MKYEEIVTLAEKELEDLFKVWDADEVLKRKVILGFTQGFQYGEAHQLSVHIEREMNRSEKLLKSIES